jgi:DNA-binding IclR family transcriptional regulator
LAELTGIPRETVRRKLKSLENRGWVTRVDRRGWRLTLEGDTPVLRTELQDYLRREIRRLVRLVRNLQEFI